MLSLFVEGIPKAQGRPRIVRFANGKAGLKDPEGSRWWKEFLKLNLASSFAGQPLCKPVSVELVFFMPVPRSFSKRKASEALAGRLRPTGKPDLDNLVKAVFDAICGVLVADDRFVVSLRAEKRYGQVPGVKIIVEEER